jgi:aspartyl-tRNA(Asn)/glutamyl-tRNA(Gln) amidotransferase subunit B
VSHPTSALDTYSSYEATIGIEVHVQLTTQSKMFCASPNQVGKEPNSHICMICTGYPGTLPVVNTKAIECAIRAGVATNCTIAPISTFDRKHYFYPDLPKNYQITQQYHPICLQGHIPIRLPDGTTKIIRIRRIHMEEDAGKNLHADISDESFVDLNRAGTPLLEIVSEPDIANATEAQIYLKMIRLIVQYLGICSGNMEEGAFRADTNVSVRKRGAPQLGTRVELKNINSFKFIRDAIEYELGRQIAILEEGGTIQQETRLWNTQQGITVTMRTKEEAADYRYFNDPDLPIISIEQTEIDRITLQMPELPEQKFNRFTTQHGLSAYEAEILIENKELADYFDETLKYSASKQIINWILRDLLGYLKEASIALGACKITPQHLATLIDMLESDKVNNRAAKEIFMLVAQTGQDPLILMKEKGLEQIGSAEELAQIVREIIAQYPDNVTEYRQAAEDRKQRVIGFFVGQAMKKTKGKGNPQLIQELFKKYL